jgi:LCP family protein required for cell wall assembly
MSVLRRALIGGVLVALLSAATVASAVLLEVKEAVDIFTRASKPISSGTKDLLADVAPGKPQTILVIGDDRRKSEVLGANGKELKHPPPTRSDTMLLVRLNPDKGATALMSLPRDLLVKIPGYGRAKLNEAFADGGDELTLKTVRELVGVPIHHYVRVTFWGFRGAVDRLKCVYVDVDHKYFNDNNPPVGGGGAYAAIDIGSGYQKLCGTDALSYVRYRHLDNDLVRAARQQTFLGEAKNQIAISSAFADKKQLLKIFGESVRTDIDSSSAILSLLRLVALSAAKPTQEIPFPATDASTAGGSYLEISDSALKRTVERFVDVKGPEAKAATTSTTSKRKRKRKKKATGTLPAGIIRNKPAAEQVAVQLQAKLARTRVYYPTAMVSGGVYRPNDSRAYSILDRSGKRHRSYRIVVNYGQGSLGEYYGVQGTTWGSPPILDDPSGTTRRGGRTLQLYRDGSRYKVVAWKSKNATYWVSNTLRRSLTNAQMLAIAGSLRSLAG